MERTELTKERGYSRSSSSTVGHPHGRDTDLKERRRRWMEQQEREREHERLKQRKIEEWERKRRAEEGAKNDKRRSAYRSRSSSADRLPCSNKKVDLQTGIAKPTVMSQKFESSDNNMRMFKGREGTTIDIAELRRIKVDIHRNITATDIGTELQREILDPEDVKLKRREGEGAKPIFERKELKPVVPTAEVEERRTVVALDNDRMDRRSHSTRRRSASPTKSRGKHVDNSRPNHDIRSSRRENSERIFERSERRRSTKHDSEKGRGPDRSMERRESYRREDSRDRRSPRRSIVRRDRSSSHNRESRRTDTRQRSSRDQESHRESRDHDDFRDTRIQDNRMRERPMPMPHHYADTVPFPLYYEGFHPRPMMVGPMISMSSQMPMGRGRMPSIMGPMRPLFPPRFIPPDMFRPGLNPNQRFNRMF